MSYMTAEFFAESPNGPQENNPKIISFLFPSGKKNQTWQSKIPHVMNDVPIKTSISYPLVN